MAAKNLTTLSVMLFALVITSCGGNSPSLLSLPTVHASGPQCFNEQFTPLAGHVSETKDSLWFTTTQACDIGTEQDETYTLMFDHAVQTVILQQGSNTGSFFEWDMIMTVTRPDGRQVSIQQQFDKHSDVVGNRQTPYTVSWSLPAGTTVNLHRRQLPAGYCTQAGIWGSSTACATGQSVQLIGPLN